MNGLEFLGLQLSEDEALGWTLRRIYLSHNNSMAKCWTAHAVYEYSEIKRPPHSLLCLIPLEPASLPLSCKAFPVGYLYSLGPHPTPS